MTASAVWIRVGDSLPPPSTDPARDYGAWTDSEDVLATDGAVIIVARVRYWADPPEDGGPEFIEHGRDGYRARGLTYWASLPSLPGEVP